MKKHIVKIMMLLAVPALAVVSCDSYDRTEVVPTITADYNQVTLFENETVQLTANPANLTFTWESLNPDIATVDANGLVTGLVEGATSVIAKSGDLSFEVEVIVQKKVAITGVEFRDGDVNILSPGVTRNIIITQIPSGGNDIPMTDFEWWVDDENIARVSQSGVVKALDYGTTTLHYRRGQYEIEGTISVSKSSPKGTLPRLSKNSVANMSFKNFDNGGEGIGYHDLSNRGGVDVEGNLNVGYTTNGEWLAYTIFVEDAGTYKCTMLASSGNGSGMLGNYQWYLTEVAEGNEISPQFKLNSGGGWPGPWMPAETEVTLPAGLQRIFFYMHNGVHNLTDFSFEYVGE